MVGCPIIEVGKSGETVVIKGLAPGAAYDLHLSVEAARFVADRLIKCAERVQRITQEQPR